MRMMAPKIILSTPRSFTSALSLALKTAAPLSRPLSSSSSSSSTVRRLHNTTNNKNSSTAMGRSGYDTTNMKTAARPRPAAKGSASGSKTAVGADGKKANAKQPAPDSEQQQGEGGGQSKDATVSGQGMNKSTGKSENKEMEDDEHYRCGRVTHQVEQGTRRRKPYARSLSQYTQTHGVSYVQNDN